MLIALDCDRTMWNHPDATRLSPPLKRISDKEVIDSKGEYVKLNEGIIRFLRYVKLKGHKTAVISWNEPQNVFTILSLLDLNKYFDEIIVEPHPNKALMLEKALNKLKVKPEEVIFIDDNPRMIEVVRSRFPQVICIQYGKDIVNFNEAIEKLSKKLGEPLKAYVALPIVHADNLEFNKEYVNIVENCGLVVLSKWVSGEVYGPILSPKEVFKRDLGMVVKADLLIADVTKPSHGVGMEIMYAYINNKKIIATYHRGSKLSALIRGMPGIHLVEYSDIKELEDRLWRKIYEVFSG